MSEFGPEPSETAVAAETDEWVGSQDTRSRVKTVVTGLREPTAAAKIAAQAHCSATTARKYLAEFVELGIVRRTETENGSQYSRNEAYFEWRRANELAQTASIEELIEQLADLEDREAAFQSAFSTPTPEAVDVSESATHEEIESQLAKLREWSTVRAEIARHRDAVRIARRADSGLTA